LPRAIRVAAALFVACAAAFAAKDVAGGKSVNTDFTYDAFLRVFAISRALLVVLTLLVLLKRRPARSDWLLFGALLGLSLDVYWPFVPPRYQMWCAALANASIGTGMALLVVLALPQRLQTTRRVLALSAVVGNVIAASGFSLAYLDYASPWLDNATFSAIAPWIDRLRWSGMLFACAAIAFGAHSRLRTADETERPKALVLAVSLAPIVILTSAHALAIIKVGRDVGWARDLDSVGNVLTASGLVYGALTRRLIDPEFYISAALAATLTSATLTVIAFVAEHYVPPALEGIVNTQPFLQPFGEGVKGGAQLVTAFIVFLFVNVIHERCNELTRDLIFHHREEHLRELRSFGDRIVEREGIDVGRALVEAAVEHVGSDGAALYLRDAEGFRLTAVTGMPAARRLLAASSSVPQGRLASRTSDGGLSLPMPIGTVLAGFLQCARKANGTDYAPDEIAALALATREAGLVLGASSTAPARALKEPGLGPEPHAQQEPAGIKKVVASPASAASQEPVDSGIRER
jgi:hypothetical protein